ncbi:hypothetical protein CLOACE_05430 [Clostridium acetireducens DSM 10703]|jgi:uncharacterized protein YebE (UPF0316 family)|uniref:UPF0316 protein CLOACE_05430 n=1 Tax=Clostridium acetireducens DSM 10703 TaxID=1121290 RepID=A0A1E8F0J1_9CLOT|nr:DUF5698 domain-containing protein [Clostridium acetireducens]OFI06957.1 hypothetical protein CLOACE_05430 [Clostridium acetireducens DSM 10703]
MLEYLGIFLAKILEVSLMTIRTVLITRGEKIYGAIIGFFEVSIWVYVVSFVLVGLKEDPIKIVIYGLGFSCGIYLGSIIEEKIALGLLTITAITSNEEGEKLAKILRDRQIGVTVIQGEGINSEKRKLLLIHVKRRRKNQVVKLIENSNIKTVISIADTRTVYGGFGIKK